MSNETKQSDNLYIMEQILNSNTEHADKLREQFNLMDNHAYRNYISAEGAENVDLARYFFHVHTDLGSPKDSILKPEEYVKIAKKMGAQAISVTDHGSMYAVQTLYDLCSNGGPKLIIGVEFYVCDTVGQALKKHTRLHLVAYAKNIDGYHALCRLVTASGKRVITLHTKDGDLEYPCISKKLLEEYVGPGSAGHGNVILTSACVGGVLIGMTFASENAKKNVEILNSNIKELTMAIDGIDMTSAKIKSLETEKEALKPIAAKNYSKIDTLSLDPEDVKRQKEETSNAKEQITAINGMIKGNKKMMTSFQKTLDKISKIKYCPVCNAKSLVQSQKDQAKDMLSEILDPMVIASKFESEAEWYDQCAGHGNWYIEIQYHGIPEEKEYMHMLAEIARKHEYPLVAANDAHMAKSEDAIYRKYINSLRFNKWEEPQIGDEELYLKNDAALFKSLKKAVTEEDAFNAMLGREAIAEACNVELKKAEHYPKYAVV